MAFAAGTSSSACRAESRATRAARSPAAHRGGATVDAVLTASAAGSCAGQLRSAHRAPRSSPPCWQRTGRSPTSGWRAEPDLVIVAPATATCCPRRDGPRRRRAHGVAARPDRAGARAPAMNDAMYAHPARTNVSTLAARGWVFRGPETGPLAEDRATVRADERAETISSRRSGCCCSVRRGGGERRRDRRPTREHLDPVRVVTNPSTSQGYALAAAAYARGADVVWFGTERLAAAVGGDRRSASKPPRRCSARAGVGGARGPLRHGRRPADYRPTEPSAAKLPATRSDHRAGATPYPRLAQAPQKCRGGRVRGSRQEETDLAAPGQVAGEGFRCDHPERRARARRGIDVTTNRVTSSEER